MSISDMSGKRARVIVSCVRGKNESVSARSKWRPKFLLRLDSSARWLVKRTESTTTKTKYLKE